MERAIQSGVIKALGLCLLSSTAYSGGFSLYTEGSTSELSVFAAGSAAEAPDASTAWYNPAGLVLLPKREIVLNGIGIVPSTKLSGQSTFTTVDDPPIPPYRQNFEGLESGQRAFLPTVHGAYPLGEKSAFGFSVLMPYGLSSDWPGDSPLRYAGTYTELLTLDISPDIAGYITDNLSIGLGLDFQFAKVSFNAVAGSPAELDYFHSMGGIPTATFLDSRSENTGNSFGLGFHGGLLYMFNHGKSRLGFNFQSAIQHEFRGTSTLTGRLADPDLENPQAVYELDTLSSNQIRLPNVTTLSFYHEATDKLVVLGSAVLTGWSVFENTLLTDVAGFDADEGVQAPIDILTQQQYRDAWRFALGGTYALNDRWTARFGGGYDQTPTVDQERDARLPDVNRWAVAFGLYYHPRPTVMFNAGYVYLWGEGKTPVNKTQIINNKSSVTVTGWGTAHAQLAGLQVVWRPLD